MNFDDDIKQMNICFQAKLQLQHLRDNARKEQVRRNDFNNRCEVQSGVDTPEITIPVSDIQSGVDTPEITIPVSDNSFAYSEKIDGRHSEKIVSKLDKSKYEISLFSLLFNEDPSVQKCSRMACVEDKIISLLEADLIPRTASGGVIVSDIVDELQADNAKDYKVTAENVRLILRRHGWRSAKSPRSDSSDGKQLRVWYPPFNNFK